MKRRTFYHLSLAIPYLALIVSGAVTFLASGFDVFTDTFGSSPGIFIGVTAFFTVAGIVWGPLYTWMVIVMLLWGRKRSTDDIRRLYLLSPFLLACSMGLPALVIDPGSSGRLFAEGILRMNNMGFAIPVLFGEVSEEPLYIGMAWLFMAAICIVVGYAFVGTVVWIERGLTKRGKFKDEPELSATKEL
jgi:hypothetical protein